jgi:hypothetical protein
MVKFQEVFKYIGLILLFSLVVYVLIYLSKTFKKNENFEDNEDPVYVNDISDPNFKGVRDFKLPNINTMSPPNGKPNYITDPSNSVESPSTYYQYGDFKTNLPNKCLNQEQLTQEDLLPKDEHSQWAQIAPSGVGSLEDKNFLVAGYHIGINTVGQSLRNGNLQLRSDPPNPQIAVGPWNQSTIEPDLNRKPFEIGSC